MDEDDIRNIQQEHDLDLEEQEIRGIALLAAASRPRQYTEWDKDILETVGLAKKYEQYIRTGEVTL